MARRNRSRNTIDTEVAAKKVADWLGSKYPAAQDIRIADLQVPNSAGMSNETVLFTATWLEGGTAITRGMVARVQPAEPGVFPVYDLSKKPG